MSERILIVEDQPAIVEAVAHALTVAGYDVDSVGDGDGALAVARAHPYDLMILDLLLPGTPGEEVCRQLRAESDLPIIMLTARAGEEERIAGLALGADDYITKPFSVPELLSRVRSLLRRRALDRVAAPPTIDIGGLTLDLARHSVSVAGQPVLLTRSEFRLVALLASQPNRPFTREDLIRQLWDSDFVGDRRAIDVHVSNLRRKLEDEPRHPRRIITVRGVGYKLVAA